MLRALDVEVSGGFPADRMPLTLAPELQYTPLAGNIAHVVLDAFVPSQFAMLLDDELRGVDGLVLDLRRNTAGREHSSQAWCLLAYLMEGSFCPMRWLRLSGRAGEAVPASAGVWSATVARPFDRPVALLIGRQTGLAGEDFAATFDAARRGLLLGEATGGDALGVPPHQLLRPRAGDAQAGRDAALLAAWQALQPTQAAARRAAGWA